MTRNEARLTLYSRDYCHLCHDMLAALEAMRGECGVSFSIDVVDVDDDPGLVALYDERVPVLVIHEGAHTRELCHYFLDKDALRACLAG